MPLPPGSTVIVCTRGHRGPSKPCVVCGRSAGLLCDFELTGQRTGELCSRPLCAAHTYRPSAGVDLCPAHAEIRKQEAARG
jgi:hypothetical protein